jgi:hypothetical protein
MQMDIWVATTATEAASPWQQLQVCPLHAPDARWTQDSAPLNSVALIVPLPGRLQSAYADATGHAPVRLYPAILDLNPCSGSAYPPYYGISLRSSPHGFTG